MPDDPEVTPVSSANSDELNDVDTRWTADSARVPSDVTPELLVCTAVVRGDLADGAACSVVAGAYERFALASTDHHTRNLEEVQFTLWQGPGPEAVDSGVPRLVADVCEATSVWPLVADAVVESPARSLASLPLVVGSRCVGLFTAYRRRPGEFSVDDVAALVAFADALASLAANRLRDDRDGPLPPPQVAGAVRQVAMDLDRHPLDALALMRAHAFRTGRTLSALVADLMLGTTTAEDIGRRPDGH
ncbi:GAF domain-containing protein [Nocardioides aestuarii]|uniref:GAF domain-containing protein n=1 Tax=Nocardioides aestuarii TaxID=252231 RepID=A0ABW4TUY2_9ACTN